MIKIGDEIILKHIKMFKESKISNIGDAGIVTDMEISCCMKCYWVKTKNGEEWWYENEVTSEKRQMAVNLLNAYNLKKAMEDGRVEEWINLEELPNGEDEDIIINKYYPVYPKGHLANKN